MYADPDPAAQINADPDTDSDPKPCSVCVYLSSDHCSALLAVRSVSLYVYIFRLISATATTLDTLFQLERAVTALLRLTVRSVALYVYVFGLINATATTLDTRVSDPYPDPHGSTLI